MGAYWQIILPVAVVIPKEEETERAEFEKKFDHLYIRRGKENEEYYAPKHDFFDEFFLFYRKFLTVVFERSKKRARLNCDPSCRTIDDLT